MSHRSNIGGSSVGTMISMDNAIQMLLGASRAAASAAIPGTPLNFNWPDSVSFADEVVDTFNGDVAMAVVNGIESVDVSVSVGVFAYHIERVIFNGTRCNRYWRVIEAIEDAYGRQLTSAVGRVSAIVNDLEREAVLPDRTGILVVDRKKHFKFAVGVRTTESDEEGSGSIDLWFASSDMDEYPRFIRQMREPTIDVLCKLTNFSDIGESLMTSLGTLDLIGMGSKFPGIDGLLESLVGSNWSYTDSENPELVLVYDDALVSK